MQARESQRIGLEFSESKFLIPAIAIGRVDTAQHPGENPVDWWVIDRHCAFPCSFGVALPGGMGCCPLGKAVNVPIGAGSSKDKGDIIGVWLLVDNKVMKVGQKPHGCAD